MSMPNKDKLYAKSNLISVSFDIGYDMMIVELHKEVSNRFPFVSYNKYSIWSVMLFSFFILKDAMMIVSIA